MTTKTRSQSQIAAIARAEYAVDMKPEKVEYSAANLQRIRKQRRISQPQLGRLIGVSKNTVLSYESKTAPVFPPSDKLAFIGWVLNVEWRIPPVEPPQPQKGPSSDEAQGAG